MCDDDTLCCNNLKCNITSGKSGICSNCVAVDQSCQSGQLCCDEATCIKGACVQSKKYSSENAFFLNNNGKCLTALSDGTLQLIAKPCVWEEWDKNLKAFWFWYSANNNFGVEVKGTPNKTFYIVNPSKEKENFAISNNFQQNANVILTEDGWIMTKDYSLGVVVVDNQTMVWKNTSETTPTAFTVELPKEKDCKKLGGKCAKDADCCLPYKSCGKDGTCVACFSVDRPKDCFTPQVPVCVSTPSGGHAWECVEPSTICPDVSAADKCTFPPNRLECNVDTRKWECNVPQPACENDPPVGFKCEEGNGYMKRCDIGTGNKWVCQSYCKPDDQPFCEPGKVSLCYPDSVTGINKWHCEKRNEQDPCSSVPIPKGCPSDYKSWMDEKNNCVQKCMFDMDKADLLELWKSNKTPLDSQTATVLGQSGETATVYFDDSTDEVSYEPTRNCSRPRGAIQKPLDEWEQYLLRNPDGNVTKDPDGSFVLQKCITDPENPEYCKGNWYFPEGESKIMCPFESDPNFCKNNGDPVLDPTRKNQFVTCNCSLAKQYMSKYDDVKKRFIGSNCQYSDNTTCAGLGAASDKGICSGLLGRTTYWTMGTHIIFRVGAKTGNVDTAPLVDGTRQKDKPWTPLGKITLTKKNTAAASWTNPIYDLCNTSQVSLKSPNKYISLNGHQFLTLTTLRNPDTATIFCHMNVQHESGKASTLTIYLDPTKPPMWSGVYLNTSQGNNQFFGDGTLISAKSPFVWTFNSGYAILTLTWEPMNLFTLSYGSTDDKSTKLNANGNVTNGNVSHWDKSGLNYYLKKGSYQITQMFYNSLSNNNLYLRYKSPTDSAETSVPLRYGTKKPNGFYSCCQSYKVDIITSGNTIFNIKEDNTPVRIANDINAHATKVTLRVVPLDPAGEQGIEPVVLSTANIYQPVVTWSNQNIVWSYDEYQMNGNSTVFLSLDQTLYGFSDIMGDQVTLQEFPDKVINVISMAANAVNGVLAVKEGTYETKDGGTTWAPQSTLAGIKTIDMSDDGQRQILAMSENMQAFTLYWGGANRNDLNANKPYDKNNHILKYDIPPGPNYYLKKGMYQIDMISYSSISDNNLWINIKSSSKTKTIPLGFGSKQGNFYSCCTKTGFGVYKQTKANLNITVDEDGSAVYLLNDINRKATGVVLTITPLTNSNTVFVSTNGGGSGYYDKSSYDTLTPNVKVSMTSSGSDSCVVSYYTMLFGTPFANWKNVMPGKTQLVTGMLARNPEVDTSYVIDTSGAIYKGQTWSQVPWAWTPIKTDLKNVHTAYMDCSYAASVVAIVCNSPDNKGSDIYASTNFGQTWLPTFYIDKFIASGIVVSPAGRTIIVAGIYQNQTIQVITSTDYGTSWTGKTYQGKGCVLTMRK
jgi:hypothetical protein